nr:MAG TPA: ASCH domain protein [Caudoviricetes sp.]
MKKIMFNDHYGLTQAVLEGRKTQTRRMIFKRDMEPPLHVITPEYLIAVKSRYKLGETIAIAQKYEDLIKDDEFYRLFGIHGMPLECIKYEKGCTNKMFVRADLMPHHIRITNIRVERLQDISVKDCLAEGICHTDIKGALWGVAPIKGEGPTGTCENHSVFGRGPWHMYSSVRRAYAALIDRISGKGTWDSNPYVFVYDFEIAPLPNT